MLERCALIYDIDALPLGDQTEVGEKVCLWQVTRLRLSFLLFEKKNEFNPVIVQTT